MKKRSMVLAALAPLIAIGGANAAMDEMEKPEMRVWSAAGEPDEEGMAITLQIVASQSTQGSNSMVVESVSLITTKTGEDEDGNMMTEVTGSVDCAGPFMVEGRRTFAVEAAMMEEETAMMEEEEGAETAESAEAEDEGCAFAVAGEAWHTYRAWHSWDLAGRVTIGEASMDFDIADPAAAMILEEPEPEPEGEAEGSESS